MTRNRREKEEEAIPSFSSTENTFFIGSEYSIYRSITKGWKIYADAPRQYWLMVLPGILLAGIALTGVVCGICYFWVQHIIPADIYINAGAPTEVVSQKFAPTIGDWLVYAFILIAGVLLYRLSKWAVWAMVRRRRADEMRQEGDTLEKWRTTIGRIALRMFRYNALLWLQALAVVTSVGLLGYLFLKEWSPFIPLYLIFTVLLFIIISIVFAPGRTVYVLDELKLREAFKFSFRYGTKRFGGLLIISTLTFIPFILIAGIAVLPLTVFPLAVFANVVNEIIGEPSGIPNSVFILYVVASVIVFSVVAFMATLRTLPIILKTISLKSSNKNA